MQLSSLDHQYQVIPLKVIIELFQANSYFPTKLSQIKSPSIRTVGFFCCRPHRCGVTFSPAFLQPVSQAHTHRYTSIHLRTRLDGRHAGRGLQSAGSVSRAEDERTPGSGAVQTHAYTNIHTYIDAYIHHTHIRATSEVCSRVFFILA